MADPLPKHTSVPPTTTVQQDMTTAGQRRINLVWEGTQASIALLVTIAVAVSTIFKIENATLTNAFFLIIGFYFSRTNHSAIGGTGRKPSEPYQGR